MYEIMINIHNLSFYHHLQAYFHQSQAIPLTNLMGGKKLPPLSI